MVKLPDKTNKKTIPVSSSSSFANNRLANNGVGEPPPPPPTQDKETPLLEPTLSSEKSPPKTDSSLTGKTTKIALAVLGIFFILASIPVAVYLVRQKQEIRKEAYKADLEPASRPTKEPRFDRKAGCVFSLRYDKLNEIDPVLKEEARVEINKLKDQIKAGMTGQETLAQLTGPTITKEELKTYFESRKEGRSTIKLPENPYAKFQIHEAINFCFQDSKQRDEFLGRFFYETNPNFEEELNKLSLGEVSAPFLIYKSSPGGAMDYAWAIILREK